MGLKCSLALSLLTVDSILNIGIEAIGLNSMVKCFYKIEWGLDSIKKVSSRGIKGKQNKNFIINTFLELRSETKGTCSFGNIETSHSSAQH